MYLGYQNGQIKFYTEEPLDKEFYNLDEVIETQDEYVLDGEEYVLKDEAWEEKQAQAEKERIGNLTCTKRVFALMLQEMGVDYLTQLKPLIESNPQAQLEWELCIELERKNPLLDIMAMQLGITSQKLDALFKYANGEITIDEFKAIVADVNNSETTGEENPVIDEVTNVEDVNNIEE